MTNPETTVVNARNTKYDQLIDRTTIFGNPFKIGQHGTREEVIRKFRAYFYRRIERDPVWRDEVLKLKGKIVGCHCVPLPCHGSVYADYLNSYDQVERYRITPILESLLEDINRLATEEGWYPPELEGEALFRIKDIDSLSMREIIRKSDEDREFDIIGEIQKYVDLANLLIKIGSGIPAGSQK